ncbi:MAG: hypothetical protein OXI96_08100 [Acidimicrobiaceae bacterium]|nr:hypothetical protein [Acidimicrobiaceae bacterium]
MIRPNPVSERVLLVEGRDDERVIRELCEHAGFSCDFSIIDKNGKDRLLRSIRNEVEVSGRTALGVVLDANNDIAARWQAVRNQLSRADTAVQPDLDPTGSVIQGMPRVGVWIMPDNQNEGQLEDFVAAMIPQNDVVWPLAQDYIKSIPDPHRPSPLIKAQVHAWLAARPRPRHMGTAIQAGDFDTQASLAESFINWMKRLFER